MGNPQNPTLPDIFLCNIQLFDYINAMHKNTIFTMETKSYNNLRLLDVT